MLLATVALIAGILTAFAPCVLPVLPVILGTTALGRKRYAALVVIASLSFSILLFTFLLKVTTLFVSIPENILILVSGSVIALYGLFLVFPTLENIFSFKRKQGRNELLSHGIAAHSYGGDILVGAAMGPIFATCSPTYFFILASVLPVSFVKGSIAMVAYVVGLALMLLFIAMLGERMIGTVNKVNLRVVRRCIGVLFVLVGILIAVGLEKKIETHLYESTPFDLLKLEYHFLKYVPVSV